MGARVWSPRRIRRWTRGAGRLPGQSRTPAADRRWCHSPKARSTAVDRWTVAGARGRLCRMIRVMVSRSPRRS
ncbi:DUF995 domain-containing protein [Streptomyces mirabilis]|uniref:DUF995 domain-containing protein n=1 Tax=Streptomyces mirabilis TaxID=68239 RepID=UPI0036DDB17D